VCYISDGGQLATLSIPREYADGQVYTASEIDDPYNAIETFLNVTGINDDNIQNSGITGSTKLVTGSVSSAKLADSAVTTNKLADQAVTTAKLADLNVTAGKIANATITTTQISSTAGITGGQLSASAGITGSQLSASANIAGSQLSASAAITGSQLAAAAGITPGQCDSTSYHATGSASSTSSSSSTSYFDLCSVTMTTVASRPAMVFFGNGTFRLQAGGTDTTCSFQVLRDSTVIAQWQGNTSAGVGTGAMYATAGTHVGMAAGALGCMDIFPSAASHTYKLQAKIDGGGGTLHWDNIVPTVVQV